MKTGRLLKTVSVILILTFMCQTIVSANPDIMSGGTYLKECLPPQLRLQGRSIPIRMQMTLVRIAKTALEQRVLPERMREFIRGIPALTPELRDRIVLDRCGIDPSRGKVTLACRTGTGDDADIEIYRLYRRDPVLDPGAENDTEKVVFGDMVMETMVSADVDGSSTAAPRGSGREDITGAAEGSHAVHEGYKELVVRPAWLTSLLWIPFVGKMIRRWFGNYVIRGQKGVNDVIREFWTSGSPGERYSECPDMERILDELRRTPTGQKIARSITDNDHRIWMYDTGSRYFTEGISTHYGIRSGSVHITTKEYFRLQALGWEHLAARIAHEVTEIDSWRNRANMFMKDGTIESLGSVPGIYDEGWGLGIRKWIRQNCNEEKTGPAQQLDRKYHKKGVDSEVSVLISGILDRCCPSGEAYQGSLLSLSELAGEFMDGRYSVLVDDPLADVE
ncbi:MAG: hypothetical protein GF392_01990, partial [Candidatus Omnitrophica bacterium]|nr:hypothetical protein [Candidatus Omnitrophota bacterium]